jgi:hypothetical protein
MAQHSRPRRTKRKKSTKLVDSIGAEVAMAKGGFAHDAKSLERPPTMEELKQVKLDGEYPQGNIPAAVTYGRKMHVLKLMLDGHPPFKIAQYCQTLFNMSRTQTNTMVAGIRREWAADLRDQMMHVRDEQIMRLMNDLAEMRSLPSTAKDWTRIRGHEQLLASIQGTIQPVRVAVIDKDVAQRDALTNVINDLLDAGADLEVVEAEGHEA